jgi:hypothetical protein
MCCLACGIITGCDCKKCDDGCAKDTGCMICCKIEGGE